MVRGTRFCEAHQRQSRQRDDALRTREQPWRRWYWTQRWRAKARAQLRAQPCCAECAKRGMVTVATVCDHVIPHRGDPDLFWQGEVQSLCATCHSSTKQAEERRGSAGRPAP